MNKRLRLKRQLIIEQLEHRDLLCGSTGATANLPSAVRSNSYANQAHSVAAAMAAGVVRSAAVNHTSTGHASEDGNETQLSATLTDSNNVAVGTAYYESEVEGATTMQKLVVRLTAATPNATYDITVGATDLGTLTTDANGKAQMTFKSTSPPATTSATTAAGTLPADFTLAAGGAIALASTDTSVPAVSGTFATTTGEGGSGDCHAGGDWHEGHSGRGEHGNVSRLVAPLSNADAAAGKAVSLTMTHSDGTTTQILHVHVTGADPSTTLPVAIDGTPVGSIDTDANGNGTLILSTSPKNSHVGQLPTDLTISASSAITVGSSITGTFDVPPTPTTTHVAQRSSSFSFGFRRR